ncbi:leukocyte elastase inhibitor-like isoform X1 [Oratosquilla oratoria]|uniref:leukocyte elastase inhibitor-like isoform X1 n=2 Tax=Oratosquilla oratoria TaxID=337810 RepID=UPI003F767B3C
MVNGQNPNGQNRNQHLLILLIMMNPGMALSGMVPYANQEAVQKLAVSQNAFTLALYKELASAKTGNMFFSPLSIMTAISMVYTGARGITSEEIQKVLQLPTDTNDVLLAYEEIIKDFKTVSEDYKLSTSNAAYVHEGYNLLDEFKSVLETNFKSLIKSANFNDPEPVRNEINTYVQEETADKIKELIPKGILNSDTRMVLINAVYFKGLWENQFDPQNTRVQPFWVDEATKVDVDMMNIEKKFRWGFIADLEAQGLELSYKGSRLSMIILLPKKKNGLAEMEKKLDNFNLFDISKKLTFNDKIKVSIPKFKLEETYEDLEKTLSKMGMTTLFDDRCDLSGISGEKDLVVTKVVHKSFVEVNEEGSEAAAATAVIMSRCMVLPQDPFIADHPFLFFIMDQRSGLVLFTGRLTNPPQASTRLKEEL